MNKISFSSVDQKSKPMELKVFKRSNAKDSVISNSSNPFGMTFKGKVLSSDVFESSQEKEKAPIGSKIKNANIAFCAAVANKVKNIQGTFAKFKAATSGIIATTKHLEEIMKTDVTKKIIGYFNTIRNPRSFQSLSKLKDDFVAYNNMLTQNSAAKKQAV